MEVFWSGFFGALAGGVAVLAGALISGKYAIKAAKEAAKANLDSAKEQELRRQQVLAVVGLISNRAGMDQGAPVQARQQLLSHLNMISGVFASSAEVQDRVRAFHASQTNLIFVQLVRTAAKEAGLDLSALADSDIENVFS